MRNSNCSGRGARLGAALPCGHQVRLASRNGNPDEELRETCRASCTRRAGSAPDQAPPLSRRARRADFWSARRRAEEVVALRQRNRATRRSGGPRRIFEEAQFVTLIEKRTVRIGHRRSARRRNRTPLARAIAGVAEARARRLSELARPTCRLRSGMMTSMPASRSNRDLEAQARQCGCAGSDTGRLLLCNWLELR